ncbi:MAG: DNA repair and recombination protein RadA [Candidatus Aenigmarchaeota archaeon]|nr:DNA repair and recombination protein RadA [Candidatus Aenigmarchaeota archaeon]
MTKETTVEDLPGVGPKTAEKLADSGFDDLMSIATASASEIAAIAEVGTGTAAKVIAAARSALEMGFETGLAALEKRDLIGKITTGSKEIDNLLGGGFETSAITECYGAFGSSKTQIAHQLAVNVQLPKENGGLDGTTLYIDTEHTFRPERIQQMAEALGVDPKEALSKIFIGKAYNSDHQILLADKAKDIIKENNVKLIVVDSLMSHFRADYIGRGSLADRQQKLNKHLHTLQKLADTYNACVYLTNQVMSKPDMLFGDPTQAVGGHVLHHAATFRLYLRKSKGNKRIAKLVDSPNLPDGEAVYEIHTEGVRD